MRGRWEPVGRIALYSVFQINFSLFSCSNRRCICLSILAVLSLLVAGPTSRNLVVSFRIVINLSLYSFLFRITTPDPLSGFVMMMSSFIRRDLIESHPSLCGFHSKRELSRLTWPLGRQAALWTEICDGLVERIVFQNQQILPHAC